MVWGDKSYADHYYEVFWEIPIDIDSVNTKWRLLHVKRQGRHFRSESLFNYLLKYQRKEPIRNQIRFTVRESYNLNWMQGIPGIGKCTLVLLLKHSQEHYNEVFRDIPKKGCKPQPYSFHSESYMYNILNARDTRYWKVYTCFDI